jgi:hypothetical protein
MTAIDRQYGAAATCVVRVLSPGAPARVRGVLGRFVVSVVPSALLLDSAFEKT